MTKDIVLERYSSSSIVLIDGLTNDKHLVDIKPLSKLDEKGIWCDGFDFSVTCLFNDETFDRPVAITVGGLIYLSDISSEFVTVFDDITGDTIGMPNYHIIVNVMKFDTISIIHQPRFMFVFDISRVEGA